MKLGYLILLSLFCFFACKNTKHEEEKQAKFDKVKWSTKTDDSYPYRDEMVNDVLYNDTVRTLNKTEIISLLGEPERINEGHLYYEITRKKAGAWTLHTRTMVVKIDSTDKIEWIKLHE